MNNQEIINLIINNKNIAIYKENIKKIIIELKEYGEVIILDSPNTSKEVLKNILINLNVKLTKSASSYQIMDYKEILEENIKEINKIIIIVDDFHQAQSRSVEVFKYLSKLENVNLICKYNQKYPKHVKDLFKNFKIIKDKQHEKIYIKYSVYLIISFLIGIIYLKLSFTMDYKLSNVVFGAIWMSFLTFRDLKFIGR